MKKKIVIALMMTIMCTAAVPVFAQETEVTTEAETTAETEMTSETGSEETETETETETESSTEIEKESLDYAHLNDIGYEKGTLTEAGWESDFLGMKFEPTKDMSMGVEENETLQEYHLRNGEENAVAANEMIALSSSGNSYVQLMVEVNPNGEKAEDILANMTKNEKLGETSEVRDTTIAGKTFKSVTGNLEEQKLMLAVCEDEDHVIALKIKYENAMVKRSFLNAFSNLDEAEEPESETTAVPENTDISDGDIELPEEFEEGASEVQTEAASETETE